MMKKKATKNRITMNLGKKFIDLLLALLSLYMEYFSSTYNYDLISDNNNDNN